MSRTCPGTGSRSQTVPTGSLPQASFTESRMRRRRSMTAIPITYVKEYTYLGIVGEANEKGLYRIEQRNKFSVGETH